MINDSTVLVRVCAIAWLFLAYTGPASVNADWLGAQAALDRMNQAAPVQEAEAGDEPLDEGKQLAADMDALADAAPTLDPDEAARQWLTLLDRFLTHKDAAETGGAGYGYGMGYRGYGMSRTEQDHPTFRRLLKALPPPPAWDAIRAGIQARPSDADRVGRYHTLRLWAGFLVRDSEAVKREIQALSQADHSVTNYNRYEYAQLLSTMLELLGSEEASGGVVEAFEKQIADVESGEDTWSIEVPDLVKLVGEERAAGLLRRLMTLEVEHVSFDSGEQTKSLARRIAIEQIEQMKTPFWRLVDTFESVELYEAMAKKFLPDGGRPAPAAGPRQAEADDQAADAGASPAPGSGTTGNTSELGFSSIAESVRAMIRGRSHGQDHSPYDAFGYDTARQYYVFGLIALGRAEDAKLELRTPRGDDDWGLSVPYTGLQALDRAGYTQGVYKFLHLLLSDDPGLPVWGAYSELAARLDKTDEMVELATANAARDDLPKEVHKRIQSQLVDALLAADRIDEALEKIRSALQEADDTPEYLEKLATIGVALGDRALIEQAIPQLRSLAMKRDGSGGYFGASDSVSLLVQAYIQTDQHEGAEAFLAEFMQKHFGKQSAPNPEYQYYRGGGAADYMQMLLMVYGLAGRHEDVLYLLDHWDGWQEKDLADLHGSYIMRSMSADPVLVCVGRALQATGRPDEALVVTLAAIDDSPGSDPAYELLVAIQGPDALATLDGLFELDRYEERPLIWKASVLEELGRLDEAEATIKQAIAIDPSDGEQGRGDRMRAYQVLRRIADAKGDAEQSKFLAHVDDAIRLAEDADRVYDAGMYKRGIEMYKRSLGFFADAYCIQSRLAIQLAAQGRNEEAEQHYKRAYELMPDSFGRVESHCFGCEGVFSGEQAQGIAERVFSRLVEERPDSPQVHYLMGYLRESQGDSAGALTYFRRAVELDPAYLNAWERLAESAEYSDQPIEVRDNAYLNLVRLDPLGRHTYGVVNQIVDLRALWPILESNRSYHKPAPDSIYPLKASAQRMSELEKLSSDGIGISRRLFITDRDEPASTPAEVLSNHEVFDAVADLIDG